MQAWGRRRGRGCGRWSHRDGGLTQDALEAMGTFPVSGEDLAAVSLEVTRISAGFCGIGEILQERWEVFLMERDEI